MQYRIEPADNGTRVDVVVARLSGASRSLVAGAIKRGDVTINGNTIKPSYPVEPDDILEFTIHPRAELQVLPEEIEIPILFEDDDIIVVDKPAGMVTHPAHGATSGTLVNALLSHVGALPGEALRAGLVHRLDRDTSGLLVVAKHAEMLERLNMAMRHRYIAREYLGLVHGIPEPARGTLDGPVARDPHNRLKYTILADGKPAVTHYEIREKLGGQPNAAKFCECIFRLETGRTHQIRVHMSAFGHPVVNDPVYGKTEPRFTLPGQALHAWRLSFHHPRNRAELSFESDPPKEYLAAKALLQAP